MPIIFKNVHHTYAPKTPFQFVALKDINLSIKPDSFTAIIGHTGSGKSTLIQHMNALLIPTQGTIEVNKVTIEANKTPKKVKLLRRYAGLVFQFPEYQLFEETVEKDVMFGPLNFGIKTVEAKRIAHEMLAKVGIDEKFYQRSPFELSGGERRRVAIAGILAIQPKVLILDEPTAGLDPQGALMMMQLFQQLHREGLTIIFVTHDMNLVYQYATDVVVMKDGTIIKQATPNELFIEKNNDFPFETPLLIQLIQSLNEQGLTLPLDRIHNLSDFFTEYNKRKLR
jgi:energy-coupling factor transport system ATP-binding protein